MNRLQEIEARMAEISGLVDTEGADLDALTAEVNTLTEERKAITEAAEKRAKLVAGVAAGTIGTPIATFGGAAPEARTFGADSPEYRSAWLKRLQGTELNDVEKRAYASTDTANAIPTATSDKFFEKLKKIAPMLNEITLLRVAGNLKFTAEGTNAAGALHTENTAVTPAADTVVSVSLGSNEFIKVIRISKTVSTMSIAAFEDWLVSMLSRDIARAIDNFIINDSSKGIAVATTWTTANQVLNTAGCTYANIASLIALLPASYDGNAKFLMNKATLWNKVANIADSSGKPILMTDPVNGFERSILGYPVVIDDYVTTANNAIYLGDYETYVGNLSQDVTVDRSVESGFLNNSIDYRGTAMFDGAFGTTEGIVRFVTTA